MELLITLGVILICGYFFGLVAERFLLPRVSAYLLAGTLFSEEFLGHLINLKFDTWSDSFSHICLGFIAYIIGGEINLKEFRNNGRLIFWGTIFSSFLPVILVFTTFYFLSLALSFPLELAILLAALSSTTAPAATIAIIEQFRPQGELTETTKGIVALDDALGIIVFFLITTIFIGTNKADGLISIAWETLLSMGLGIFSGICLSKFAKLSKSNDYLFPLLVGLVLLMEGLAGKLGFSSMLTCMVLGVTANNTNVAEHPRVSLLLPIQHIEELIFIVFFTLAGTHFSLNYFSKAFHLILIYVSIRGLGKYAGAYFGTKLGSPKKGTTSTWIGLTLLPQAGVAIGLLLQVVHLPQIQGIKPLIFNIVIGSTILYEIAGPILAKFAFEKAGELPLATKHKASGK